MEENQLIGIGAFIGVALVGYILFSLFIKFLIAFGMALPDSRKKFGIRATTFGRFMQVLTVVVIFIVFMLLGNKG